MKYLFTLVSFLSGLNYLQAQCGEPDVCNSNIGLYSTNDATTIAYDNMGSAPHSTFVREPNSQWKVWGEMMANNGYNDVLTPTNFTVANYPALTGTIYKMSIGSKMPVGSQIQLIVLTSTGLFALGVPGTVLDWSLTTSSTFQKITVNGETDGLPPGVDPEDVKMLFASTDTIIITTCAGNVYVLSQHANVRGNGGVGSSLQWSRVMQNATQPLTNVIVARGNKRVGYALKSNGTLWTWGDGAFLGNGTLDFHQPYAVQMNLPAGLTGVKSIQATYDSFSLTTPTTSYYILGTDKKVYALGANSCGQLGDRTTTNRTVWVNARNPDNTVINDAAWISTNEHDHLLPALAVLKTGGVLYTAGNNHFYMVGRTEYGGINHLELPAGITVNDVITDVKVGAHTTTVIKDGIQKYGYVGCHAYGSWGDGDPSLYVPDTFNFTLPPAIASCTTNCTATVTVNSPVCEGQDTVFSITADPGNTVSYSINNGPTQTVIIGSTGSANITVNNITASQTINLLYISGSSCANDLSASATVALQNPVTPNFNPINDICYGETLNPLPVLSNEGITGVWSPLPDNTATTTYTFTPDSGQCASTTQITIVVTQRVMPTFPDFSPVCYGDQNFTLPSISDNNIHGTWSPAIDTASTTVYTFIPSNDECANSVSVTVSVIEDFDFVYDGYCRDGKFYLEVFPGSLPFEMDSATFSWNHNGIQIDNSPVFDVSSYLNTTIENLPVTFTISVTNAGGCSKTKTIVLDNVFCEIQKGISVNGDNLNDYFDLRLFKVKNLSIFNRNGVKVYNKPDYYNEWHGQTDKGELLPDGTYYYLIDFADQASKTGWIYVIRER